MMLSIQSFSTREGFWKKIYQAIIHPLSAAILMKVPAVQIALVIQPVQMTLLIIFLVI